MFHEVQPIEEKLAFKLNLVCSELAPLAHYKKVLNFKFGGGKESSEDGRDVQPALIGRKGLTTVP